MKVFKILTSFQFQISYVHKNIYKNQHSIKNIVWQLQNISISAFHFLIMNFYFEMIPSKGFI